MSGGLHWFAAAFLVGGGVTLFRARRRRYRLEGLAALAFGGLLLTLLSGPDQAGVIVVVGLSALTLAGLLAVAGAMERAARRENGKDLTLDRDPLRWP